MKSKWMSLIVLCAVSSGCAPETPMSGDEAVGAYAVNGLVYAVAWKQTAAEYEALYHQGFNIARQRVQYALDNRSPGDKPLAVISDLDETLMLAHDYWATLISQGQDFFDDVSWDTWVASNRSIEFLRFCASNAVEVFYVTNRDQGEASFDLALGNLQALNFPYADAEHLTVLRDSSNKQPTQELIRENYQVVAMLGDNLNDFSREYYVSEVEQRKSLMAEDSHRFGAEFILFPNPTDGHWIRAIFGESEPPASEANRRVLFEAATTSH
jgi:5'-nucleotidase (lipoprotein e(P4) family)